MSVNSSLHPLFYICFESRVPILIYSTFFITKILILVPLFVLIFYLGHQRWRRQRSTTTISHSDFFTYHVAALELSTLVFVIFFCCGIYTDLTTMAKVGFNVCNIAFPGEILFHILTCVARYLAVVHPVTYLGLSRLRGLRIRNIGVLCVWLLCFGWIGATLLYEPEFPIIPFFCLLVVSLIAVSFCSLSVLRVLIRPGPGEVGGDEERVDQSKQRAFHTVVAITGVLWLWFGGVIVCVALNMSPLLDHSDGCVAMITSIWFTLPSSVVLPLLFLHRARKLQYRVQQSND